MVAVATLSQAVPLQKAISPNLKKLAWINLGWNVLVVLWGAVVRATGSGAGCGNHWPLCNGQVIPLSPRVDTVIEFTHRMMTGGAIWVLLALILWVFRATPKGHLARVATVVATVLLVNEAILGMLLVKLGYVTGNKSLGRVVLLSVHLSNTLLLLGAMTMIVYFLSRTVAWKRSSTRTGLVVVGIAATLIVGVSGSLAALGDTLFPSTSLRAAFVADFAAGSPLLLRLRSIHPISAFIAAAFVLWLVKRARGSRLGNTVLALLAFQILLGFADLLLLAPTWMQVIHLLGADLYWIALIWLSADEVALTTS